LKYANLEGQKYFKSGSTPRIDCGTPEQQDGINFVEMMFKQI
jgi:hypothetical protein